MEIKAILIKSNGDDPQQIVIEREDIKNNVIINYKNIKGKIINFYRDKITSFVTNEKTPKYVYFVYYDDNKRRLFNEYLFGFYNFFKKKTYGDVIIVKHEILRFKKEIVYFPINFYFEDMLDIYFIYGYGEKNENGKKEIGLIKISTKYFWYPKKEKFKWGIPNKHLKEKYKKFIIKDELLTFGVLFFDKKDLHLPYIKLYPNKMRPNKWAVFRRLKDIQNFNKNVIVTLY
jgi:hypothetical protein